MTVHPAAARLLASLPWLTVHGRGVDMEERGRYYRHLRVALIRSGQSIPEWSCTAVHEALHAQRGDEPCADPASEAAQEERTNRDAARLLIEIHALGEVAAQFPDDAHRIAEELGVDYDTLVCRMKHLHPSERHYLRRRLEHARETA